MRLAFLGTPEAAVEPLLALLDAGHTIEVVVTRADKRRGRGAALVPSPVKATAVERGLRVAHDVDAVLDTDAELGVVVAFGRIIKPHVLDRLKMVNVHFSLLPRWRGAAPVERAILAGDDDTGVCIMAVEEGLDTGGTYACERVTIGENESAGELRARLTRIGTRLLIEQLAAGLGDPEPQAGEPTYAAKIEPEELHIDWSQPAVQVHRVVRVGKAWTTFRGKRLQVLESRLIDEATGPAPGELDGLVVGCGDGRGLGLVTVQPEGRAPQPATAWANGARLVAGERLGA